VSSLIGTLAFSNDAQPLVPADCLRQPLNSNVEVVDKPLFAAAREQSKRDDARACEFGCSKFAKAPRAGYAADKGLRLA
jgi:hypothetical protein